MKKIHLILLAGILIAPSSIQAQKKAMIEQIAALQVYLDWLKKGNNILKDGTTLIGAIKKGDFKLHQEYFDSQKSVSPAVRDSEKAKAIIHMHDAMSVARLMMIRKATESRQFSGAELKDLRQRCADLSEASTKDLDELLLVITPGTMSMSDVERIRIIERLYTVMRQKYSVQKRLNRYVLAAAEQRRQGKMDAEILRALHGR